MTDRLLSSASPVSTEENGDLALSRRAPLSVRHRAHASRGGSMPRPACPFLSPEFKAGLRLPNLISGKRFSEKTASYRVQDTNPLLVGIPILFSEGGLYFSCIFSLKRYGFSERVKESASFRKHGATGFHYKQSAGVVAPSGGNPMSIADTLPEKTIPILSAEPLGRDDAILWKPQQHTSSPYSAVAARRGR